MRLAALALVLVSGCTYYFGGDDDVSDDDVCAADAVDLRDPQTGQCQGFGGCLGIADPDWAVCGSACEGLDQSSCEATAGCRAILIDACPECDALILEYTACWAVAPSGPIAGDCGGLDAHGCSQHDDCQAVHTSFEAPTDDGGFTRVMGDFSWCQSEDAF